MVDGEEAPLISPHRDNNAGREALLPHEIGVPLTHSTVRFQALPHRALLATEVQEGCSVMEHSAGGGYYRAPAADRRLQPYAPPRWSRRHSLLRTPDYDDRWFDELGLTRFCASVVAAVFQGR